MTLWCILCVDLITKRIFICFSALLRFLCVYLHHYFGWCSFGAFRCFFVRSRSCCVCAKNLMILVWILCICVHFFMNGMCICWLCPLCFFLVCSFYCMRDFGNTMHRCISHLSLFEYFMQLSFAPDNCVRIVHCIVQLCLHRALHRALQCVSLFVACVAFN